MNIFKIERSISQEFTIALSKKGTADFADYLIGSVNHHHGCIQTVTFDQLRCLATRDRKLKTAKRFEVLE